MPMRQKGLSIFRPDTALGILLAGMIAVCVSSCGKKDSEETPKAVTPAPSAVETPEGTVSTAVGTAAAKKQEGAQTYQEHVAEIGKSAKANQSLARRVAMAQEILQAREKVLAEENPNIQARLAEIETRKTALVAAQKALVDAEKALADAFAADPEWVEAHQKFEAISKERQAGLARTMMEINEARRKGIHHAPPAESAPPASSEVPESPAPADLTLPTAPAEPAPPASPAPSAL